MARNRKSQTTAARFGPAVKALVICLLIGGSGIGFVWQKDQIMRLGHRIKSNEAKLKGLEEQNDKLRKQLANMRSPAWIEAQIKRLNLGLGPPQPAQVWRLPEPSGESSEAATIVRASEYAQSSKTGVARP